MKRLRLIVHGDRAQLPIVRKLVERLRETESVHVDVRPTWEGGDSLAIAAEAAALGVNMIIAAGGDGMIHHVMNGIHHVPERPAVGIIPMGTANDFATAAGIPVDDLDGLIDILLGDTVPVDLVRVGDSCFANVAVGGFTVNEDVNEGLKSAIGGLAYLLSGVAKLSNPDLQHLTVRGPDFEWEDDVYGFAITNARTAGGGHQLSPESRIDDGLLDGIVLPGSAPIWSATRLDSALKVHPVEEHVQRWRSQWLEIQSSEPLRLHLDGEPYHVEGCARFEVLPDHVQMALPVGSPLLRERG